jgi:hypothetical protein
MGAFRDASGGALSMHTRRADVKPASYDRRMARKIPNKPERPAVKLMSLQHLPTIGAFTAEAVVRCVLATDEDVSTWSIAQWETAVDEGSWPLLMASVTRRGLIPKGEWIAVVDDRPDWRIHIAADVQAQVDADMAAKPEVHVAGVVLLVDSASVQAVDIADVPR